MWFIKLTIVMSLIFLIATYMEWDRTLKLATSSFDTLVEQYKLKPQPDKRTVLIIECEDDAGGVCSHTLKSILDQSIRVHDIAVNTNHPEKVDPKLKTVVSIHKPGTEILREPSTDTAIIKLENGKTYSYDAIEAQIT